MRARGKLALDHLDEARGRAAVHIDARIQVLDSARVRARPNRKVGGQHAHAARTRAVNGGTCARCDHADDRNIEHLLRDAQGCGRCRIASDDHDLDIVVREPAAHLQGKRAHLVLIPHAIGTALGVAKVVNRLMRKGRCDRARDRQAAQARVEHADRTRVPGQILDIGHYLTRFSLEKCDHA